MSYLVFARKFRPQTFEEVVGQEPIITTLKNAIAQNRIPQNFLFSGPRGVGKTSVARIVAMALNQKKGPSAKLDPKSEASAEIAEGRFMDVLEFDGASNRGIDEIRNLRETVKFKPVSGQYKVYIIDEVHMLTTEAFNALLKTLEEPPPHVKFIFATTELHKVPLTILSRCHRFHFKRIPLTDIVAKLTQITKSEKLKFEKNAIFQIAKASEGSLRDAEGLLDQLSSFSEGKVSEEDVLLALGLASEEIYFSVLDALKEKDAKKIFSLISELYDGGRDLVQFAKGLLEIFRHLLLFQCSAGADEFVEMSEEGLAELKKHRQDFSRGEILLALSLLGSLQSQLRRNLAPPKLLVETALLKLMHVDGLKEVQEMLQAPSQVAAPQRVATAARSAPPAPARTAQASPQRTVKKKAESLEASPPAPVQGSGSLDINQLESIWARAVEYVKTKRMSIGIFLSEAAPVEVKDQVITLGLPEEFQFHKEMLDRDSNKRLVEESIEVLGGGKNRVQFVVTKAETIEKTPQEEAPAEDLPPESDEGAKLPDIITEALDIFEGARIVRKD